MTAKKRRLNALKKAQVMNDREKNALSDEVKRTKKGGFSRVLRALIMTKKGRRL